jgi:hypothetical protein
LNRGTLALERVSPQGDDGPGRPLFGHEATLSARRTDTSASTSYSKKYTNRDTEPGQPCRELPNPAGVLPPSDRHGSARRPQRHLLRILRHSRLTKRGRRRSTYVGHAASPSPVAPPGAVTAPRGIPVLVSVAGVVVLGEPVRVSGLLPQSAPGGLSIWSSRPC